MKEGHTHETLARDHDVKMGSDRGFGVVFAVVFALIGIWPALRLGWIPRFDAAALRLWALAVAGLFLAAAVLSPSLLHPLNRLWFAFGLLLGKIMAPVVMGLLFVLAVVPTGLIMRLRGLDLLRLKIDRGSKSYWIMREPPGPARDSMKNQF
jgi:saxitoxin biosynthesis operon SxtJ-like protein